MPTPKDDDYIDNLLREKQGEFRALIEAVAADAPDIDVKIAQIVEGEPEEVRLAIVEHVRTMIREREEEEARAAGLARNAEEKRLHEMERKSLHAWLTWLMSETYLKKLRLAALIPLLRQQGVKEIGQELAEKGVTLSLSATNRRELGQLENLSRQLGAKTREPGKGR